MKLALLIAVSLLLVQGSSAQPAGPGMQKRYSSQSRKSPVLAFTLSAVIPGAGQLYNNEYWPKGAIQTGLFAAGIAVALSLGTESTYNASAYTDNSYYGTYTYYRYNDGSSVTTWLYVGIGVAAGAWLWSVIDAPFSAGRINSGNRASRYGHMIEISGQDYVVGIDPAATINGGGAKIVLHF